MLLCCIPLDSDFVKFLSVALLLRTFNPSVEGKCTLGVAVCSFSGVLLILAFKRRFRVVFSIGLCSTRQICVHGQIHDNNISYKFALICMYGYFKL